MKLDKVKSELKQYCETTHAPHLVFIGIMCLIIITLSPSDIMEKSLSKSGFRVVYILIFSLLILIGNLDKQRD